MFIKRTKKCIKGKTYVNHLLVESVATAKGPRHRVICSLGSLEPAPKEQWLTVGRKLQSALGGQEVIFRDRRVEEIVSKVKAERDRKQASAEKGEPDSDVVSVHTDRIETEESREAGPVHVGHQMWKRLGVNEVLQRAGLSERGRLLTEVMTLNRLISPSSEHAMPDWVRRTALADVVGEDFAALTDNALYLNLDRLHPEREQIERGLAEREKTLFSLDDTIYLYDLTSTYFEGDCRKNNQAKRGYSRDSRPDCKQVVVGLVLDREGFAKAHEVFDGNRVDTTTVDEMLSALEKRVGKSKEATVVVDRGMAYETNLKQIKDRGYHYIVASRQSERNAHLAELEDEEGWDEVIRMPSPTNPCQKKSRVEIKRAAVGDEVHILCRSDGREEKDRAIREKHEKRLVEDLKRLQKRAGKGKMNECGVAEAIGRINERYPRVARYHQIQYDVGAQTLRWEQDAAKRQKAQMLDGSYILKTDRNDLSNDEIWCTYILLTRVENAFRSMKSPLMERPIFHQIERRVQTHIFLCVLAYHLLVSIEKMFLDRGIHTSWGTLREQLTTHQVVTVVLPTSNGRILKIRKGGTPEKSHREIYKTLGIPEEVMKPVKTWYRL